MRICEELQRLQVRQVKLENYGAQYSHETLHSVAHRSQHLARGLVSAQICTDLSRLHLDRDGR